jgi:hypothetical protein
LELRNTIARKYPIGPEARKLSFELDRRYFGAYVEEYSIRLPKTVTRRARIAADHGDWTFSEPYMEEGDWLKYKFILRRNKPLVAALRENHDSVDHKPTTIGLLKEAARRQVILQRHDELRGRYL